MKLLNRDIPCQRAVELVTDYLEGALGGGQRRRFERHLRACPHCRRYLEQVRAAIRGAASVPPEAPDPETRDALVELYRRFHREG